MIYNILSACIRIRTLLNTFWVKSLFYSFGTNSYIKYGSLLNSPSLISIGCGVRICEMVWLNANNQLGNNTPTLSIGDGTYIGRFVQINAWKNVSIGSDVLISDRVYISDANHIYRDRSVPIAKQGTEFSGSIIIGDGSWIGAGAVILPGVSIGKNAIVSANAVVTRDVFDYQIVAGVPAIAISRFNF